MSESSKKVAIVLEEDQEGIVGKAASQQCALKQAEIEADRLCECDASCNAELASPPACQS
eukprot:3131596-Amphidinium_carterae.1